MMLPRKYRWQIWLENQQRVLARQLQQRCLRLKATTLLIALTVFIVLAAIVCAFIVYRAICQR